MQAAVSSLKNTSSRSLVIQVIIIITVCMTIKWLEIFRKVVLELFVSRRRCWLLVPRSYILIKDASQGLGDELAAWALHPEGSYV